MLILDATKNTSFEEVLQENALILSREIINCVCDAIDQNIPKILICIIRIPGGQEFDIASSSSYYKDALQKNMKALIVAEEYELCAKAKEYISILDSRHIMLEN